jgi:hypothetical protein
MACAKKYPAAATMRADQAINIEDLRRMAKRRLPKFGFDYIEGGCEDAIAILRNEVDIVGGNSVAPTLLESALTFCARTHASKDQGLNCLPIK